MLFLGTKDIVVGDHEIAAGNAQSFPNVQVELHDSGHLIGVEHAETVDQQMAHFLVYCREN